MFGGFQHYFSYGAFAGWFGKSPGWELNAFAAFGTMSGFSLASLALVASMSGHERARQVIDSAPGRYLVRTLVVSTWAWLVAALTALGALATSATIAQSLVIFFASVAAARAVVAMAALALFFRRFTVTKP
jgi:hypothetical protein